ncbi:MAG: FAD binding domain-containing protein, partial [Bacteroidetes bacterium]|nr:FAD binding domain-containing protein [Bacteroidota bacterium]
PHSDQFNEKEKEIRKLILKIRKEKSSLHIQTEQQHYFQPGSLEEAMLIKSKNPEALLINGATDISLLVTKKHQVLPGLIDLSAITELKQYKKYDGSVFIGAGMNMEDIRVKLENEFPALSGMLNVFGSRQIRSLATLGGNVGSASPISDTIPVLIAYDAVVHLQSIHGKRKFNMNEFITGYRRTKINADELITGITIPLPGKNSIHKSYKISKRKDLDISTVNAGFMLQIENKKITSCILAYGGMAAKTMRAENAEKFLDGKSWNRETATEASEIIYNEFSPISDARSGAEFRKLAARNLLIKFWSETTENGKR